MTRMRFTRHHPDEVCDGTIPDPRWEALACMRRHGHEGEHIAGVRQAGEADGVCYECRRPIGDPHTETCRTGKP